MKFVVLGTSQYTLLCAKSLIDSGCEVTSIISLPKENRPDNSIDIEKYSLENNVQYKEFLNLNDDDAIEYLKSLQADYFLSTWPNIISKRVLDIPTKFVIGTHPTPLPMNRGRHPLHWMIVLNIYYSTLSFFIMNENVDDGELLLQQSFVVSNDIVKANDNMCDAACNGVSALVKILKQNPVFMGSSQSDIHQNYWRRRNRHDVTLDPRMSSSMIVNIVNSFSKPYPMARLYVEQEYFLCISSIKIVEAKELPDNWHNFEHGFIFDCNDNRLKMRVEDAVVELTVDEKQVINDSLRNVKIYPPSYYLVS